MCDIQRAFHIRQALQYNTNASIWCAWTIYVSVFMFMFVCVDVGPVFAIMPTSIKADAFAGKV